jgi:hypothetical protein
VYVLSEMTPCPTLRTISLIVKDAPVKNSIMGPYVEKFLSSPSCSPSLEKMDVKYLSSSRHLFHLGIYEHVDKQPRTIAAHEVVSMAGTEERRMSRRYRKALD